MSVKLRLSTPGAGKSRHGSARVVACDEALPAPGGALKIAARIGRSADVVIELLSVSNRVDPNTVLIGDRYSKHSHNACLSQLSLSGLGHDKQRPRRSASDARGSHVGCHGVSARDRGSLADPVSHKSAWQRGASPTSLSEQKPETRNRMPVGSSIAIFR